jgi:TonB family protein
MSYCAFAQDSERTNLQSPPDFGFDMNSYLIKNLKMPEDARDNCIMGKVLVKFLVDTAGNIDSVHVAYGGVHPLLDNEAMRVIKQIPRIKPAMKDGKPIKFYLSLPVAFSLLNAGCPTGDKYYNTAIELYSKGKIEEALKFFQKAARINYDDLQALFNIASIYISKNQSADACPYLKQLHEVISGAKTLDGNDIPLLISKHCN